MTLSTIKTKTDSKNSGIILLIGFETTIQKDETIKNEELRKYVTTNNWVGVRGLLFERLVKDRDEASIEPRVGENKD